mmetsp:Transcript_80113/g.133856  ORF Transcript_80113/g.133856 Transcript_80113/m.133856 type:complete len:109 (+) Transcript_80113:999-1325(+)
MWVLQVEFSEAYPCDRKCVIMVSGPIFFPAVENNTWRAKYRSCSPALQDFVCACCCPGFFKDLQVRDTLGLKQGGAEYWAHRALCAWFRYSHPREGALCPRRVASPPC